MMAFILWIGIAYILGSIPFGFVTGKWIGHVDLREHGSRNVGATNVFRVVGKKWGVMVLILDAAKGFAAVRLGHMLLGEAAGVPYQLAIGIAAIAGHSFPVWLNFKGGKGVATSLGVFLAVALPATLAAFGFWCVVFYFTRIISLSSLAAALVFPGTVFFMYRGQKGFETLLAVSVLLCFFIFYTHRSNIQRLIRREEKRLL